jgi:hypothetical protein
MVWTLRPIELNDIRARAALPGAERIPFLTWRRGVWFAMVWTWRSIESNDIRGRVFGRHSLVQAPSDEQDAKLKEVVSG